MEFDSFHRTFEWPHDKGMVQMIRETLNMKKTFSQYLIDEISKLMPFSFNEDEFLAAVVERIEALTQNEMVMYISEYLETR